MARARCDYLSLGGEASLKKELGKGGGSSDEMVVFSDLVVKINRKDKAQERVVVVTNKALYNMNKGRKVKRRIELTRIEGLTVSTASDEFVIHVPSEYDYRITASRKADCVESIVNSRAALLGPRIPVTLTPQVHLKNVAMTKPDAAAAAAAAATGSGPGSTAGAGAGGAAASMGSGGGGSTSQLKRVTSTTLSPSALAALHAMDAPSAGPGGVGASPADGGGGVDGTGFTMSVSVGELGVINEDDEDTDDDE